MIAMLSNIVIADKVLTPRSTKDNVKILINYVLPEYIYQSRDELFVDFFSTFYEYILSTKIGKEHLERNNIYSKETALSICKYWIEDDPMKLPLGQKDRRYQGADEDPREL